MKRFIVLTMAGVMSLSVVACGTSTSSGDSASSGDEKEVITFWNIATEGADKAAMEFPINQFNEETDSGYVVESIPTQNDTYKEKLVVAMSSGECPDMYTSWSGGPMNEYIESGYAQPLDDLYEEYGLADEYMDAAIEQASYDGHIYAVPTYNVSISGIFYNKEMFDKYGLEVPETVSELEDVCDTLLENGITPFALANSAKWTGSMFFQNLAARKGGLEPFKAAVSGEGSFEDDCFIYAGEKIQEWVKKGYFPDGVNSLSEDDGQARQLMYQETAGMMLIGSWYTGTFANDSEEFYEKIGWFPFPAVDGSDADSSIQIGTIGDQFISFNCTDDKLDAAFECATYFTSDESKENLGSLGKIPPTKDAAEYLGDDEVTAEIFEAADNASDVQLWYDQYLPPAVSQVHLDTTQELFGLTITPEEAAAEVEESMEAYLADNN